MTVLRKSSAIGTAATLSTIQISETVAELAGFGFIWGPPMTGKTVAASQISETGTVFVSVPPDAPPKELMIDLCRKLGVPIRDTEHRTRILPLLTEALDERARLVVFDNAHRLTHLGREMVHYLQETAHFGVLEIHTSKSSPVLGRSIRNCGEICIPPLTGDEVRSTVPRMSPLFRSATPHLIESIDKARCKGLIGEWALFGEAASALMRRGKLSEVLDIKLARMTIALLNGE